MTSVGNPDPDKPIDTDEAVSPPARDERGSHRRHQPPAADPGSSAVEKPDGSSVAERGPGVDGGDGANPDASLTASLAWYQHIGPLPPPEELGAFAEVDKTFPDRIVRMAELDVEARAHAVTTTADAEAMAVRAGALMMVVLPLALVALAVVAMVMGWPWPVAVFSVVAPILSAIAAIIRAVRHGDQ